MGRIERGDVAMSVGTLWQIADALCVPASTLLQEAEQLAAKADANPDRSFVQVSDDAMPRLCIADSVASTARADSEALL